MAEHSKPTKTATSKEATSGYAGAIDHWLLKLFGLIVTSFAAGFSADAVIRSLFPQEVQVGAAGLTETMKKEVDTRIEALREDLRRDPPVRMIGSLQTIYEAPDLGAATGNLSPLMQAIAEGRPIYVSYNKPDDTVMPNKWLRRCDHVVQDNISVNGQSLISCFVLRVPDTNYDENRNSREFTDTALFEDHLIRSDGQYFVRKYRYENGQLVDLSSDQMKAGVYRKVVWQAVTFYPQLEDQ